MEGICLITCENFRPELNAAVAAEGWKDVVTASLPARCGRPCWKYDEVRALVPKGHRAVLLGSQCIPHARPAPSDGLQATLVRKQQCFHVVAPVSLVDELIADGAYLMTPGWLRQWRIHLEEMGFPKGQAAELFQEVANRLVLLDTGTDGNLQAELAEISAELKLPAERLAVGSELLRQTLRALVAEERLAEACAAMANSEQERRSDQADWMTAMDWLSLLTEARLESEVLHQIEMIYRTLFAPREFWLLPCRDGQVSPSGGISEEYLREATELGAPWAWTKSGEGFVVGMQRGDQLLAVAIADHLRFPEYRQRYLNLALALSGVAALSLEGANNRRLLVDAEKMASLGVLIAGVAHEINTPAGVCLAASTTLEAQTRQLRQRFKERTMKQSDLERYLESMQAGTTLISSNLERVGKLIESFRQLAVENREPMRRWVDLRTLIESVIASLGHSEKEPEVHFEILCEASLQLYTAPGDWTSILTNLITNSIRHGFRGRTEGNIRMVAELRGDSLHLDYSDDGEGLSEKTREHIFDPFFTTDLQKGMGLGMHLVYNLVRQRFGGSIVCESVQGAGAEFRIQIPAGNGRARNGRREQI